MSYIQDEFQRALRERPTEGTDEHAYQHGIREGFKIALLTFGFRCYG
jgi:hypothetical protein